MPVSIRVAGDHEGGNHVTLVRFEVLVDIAEVSERMRLIGDRCRAHRNERAIPYSNAIAATLNLLPVTVTGGMLKRVDFLASNVPGFGINTDAGAVPDPAVLVDAVRRGFAEVLALGS